MNNEIRKQIDGLPFRTFGERFPSSGINRITDDYIKKSDVIEFVEKLTGWNKVEDSKIPFDVDVIVKMSDGKVGHAIYSERGINIVNGHFDFDMPKVIEWKPII